MLISVVASASKKKIINKCELTCTTVHPPQPCSALLAHLLEFLRPESPTGTGVMGAFSNGNAPRPLVLGCGLSVAVAGPAHTPCIQHRLQNTSARIYEPIIYLK